MADQEINPRRLSLQAGLNPTAVRDIVEGRARSPRYSTVEALSGVLGVSPASLVGEGKEKDADHAGSNSLKAHVESLAKIHAYLKEMIIKTGPDLVSSDAPARFYRKGSEKLNKIVLTEREKMILGWAAIGKTDYEIAQLLNISKHTVNMHMRHIYAKIEANNRILAVVKALVTGLVDVKLPARSSMSVGQKV